MYAQTPSNNNCNMLKECLSNAIFGKVGKTTSKEGLFYNLLNENACRFHYQVRGHRLNLGVYYNCKDPLVKPSMSKVPPESLPNGILCFRIFSQRRRRVLN